MSNYINKINIKGTEYDIQGNITIGSSPYASDVVTDTITLGTGLRHGYGGHIDIDRMVLIGTGYGSIIRISDNMVEDFSSDYISLKVPTSSINEVITKDLYYNDGSNKHVPVRHPDLSTQPSILPYKFMGQYVYELLIPITQVMSNYFPKLLFDNPIFLKFDIIGDSFINSHNMGGSMKEGNKIYLSSAEMQFGKFVHVVYTSMPEEGGDYYGYNNY